MILPLSFCPIILHGRLLRTSFRSGLARFRTQSRSLRVIPWATVYGFLAPNPEQPRRPGTWQKFDITLLGRFVTVVQNGHAIIHNQEIPGITRGAIDSDEAEPGRIYLQGDHGGIAYRNICLTPAVP